MKMDYLAKPYRAGDYLTLFFNHYGKISLEILKSYLLKSVFRFFDNPIYLDSPIIQEGYKKRLEMIPLPRGAYLRHNFHHLYFKILKDKEINDGAFPLQFIEQGLHFRDEVKGKLRPFVRQTSFTVTNLHSFCKDINQAKFEIKKAFKCVRNFESDFQVKFKVNCHIKDKSFDIDFLEKSWGEKFKLNYDSNEEAAVSVDFLIQLDNKNEYELTSLEIFKTKVNSKESILVDFTIGGAERILYYLASRKKYLPIWLLPIQAITLNQNNQINKLKKIKNVRMLSVSSLEQFDYYKKVFQIPFVLNGSVKELKKIKMEVEKSLPRELEVNYFNNTYLGPKGSIFLL